jgi:hypothetical protein
MKKAIISLLLLVPFLSTAQETEKEWKYQARFGWGGYPVTEWLMNGGFGFQDYALYDPTLTDIYFDDIGALRSTGAVSAEFAWLYRDWFTFALKASANVIWETSFDAVTGQRTGTDTGGALYIVPEFRFNWFRRDMVKMYSSIGVGGLIGSDIYSDFIVLPVAQINPLGIEVGRKVFGFCEFGVGILYTGAMAGVGFRF